MNQNVTKERLAIHEASHAVVAKLFEDQLYLRSLTIANQSTAEADSNAGLRLGMIGVEPKGATWVSPSVVSLAGMVGETIATHSQAQVFQMKEVIIREPHTHIDKLLGGGDFEIFQKDAAVNARNYGTESDYEALCLSFLIDFLCSDSVWPVVEQLKEAVLKKESLTLYAQELDDLFQLTGYTAYINQNRNNLLEPFRNTVDTTSIEWQMEQMMKGGNVDLFSGGGNDKNP